MMDDIRAHRNLSRGERPYDYPKTSYSSPPDFPTMAFLSQLYALARSVAAHVTDVHPEVTHFASRSRLDDASEEVERLKMTFDKEMKACLIAKLKPSKRLASFAEMSSSRCVTPYDYFYCYFRGMLFTWVLRTSTPRSKKQRLSSDGSPTDEETTSLSPSSPPLSIATSVPSEPVHHTIVTPAMLRSLTKDIRAKYGATQATSVSR